MLPYSIRRYRIAQEYQGCHVGIGMQYDSRPSNADMKQVRLALLHTPWSFTFHLILICARFGRGLIWIVLHQSLLSWFSHSYGKNQSHNCTNIDFAGPESNIRSTTPLRLPVYCFFVRRDYAPNELGTKIMEATLQRRRRLRSDKCTLVKIFVWL